LDHPLLEQGNRHLRQRVVQFLREGYSVRRAGNIIFVCGGNLDYHMRIKFKEYCKLHRPEFEIFFPEFAMRDYFSGEHADPFDIADFETLVGELSHAVVIFPEAPGSYAEVGYFAAIPHIAGKVILALDSQYQSKDSFISLGPARKINETSKFYGTIQTAYASPDFADVVLRIERYKFSDKRKHLNIGKFKDMPTYDLLCLIHEVFRLLSIATIDDVLYVMAALFRSHMSGPKIRKLSSILVGSDHLIAVGEYGHYYTNKSKPALMRVMDNKFGDFNRISMELAVIYSGYPDFTTVLDRVPSAA